jgi:hypothetical protein
MSGQATENSMTTMTARIVHIGIERNWREVYDYAAEPENMPLWASGLASGLTRDGAGWVAAGPLGEIRVRFAPRNDFGVLDHHVTMADGTGVDNALRVVPNGSGCEVMFTLLKLPDMDDERFAADAAWVEKDLAALKTLMET